MRSCHASAYGQWLQVKTTAVTPSPRSLCSRPSVSGRARSGSASPGRIDPPPDGGPDVLDVGDRRRLPVTQAVDAAAQADGRALSRRHHVLAVYPDRGRAEETLPLGLLVAHDLHLVHRLRVDTLLPEHPLELLERLRVRGTALPPEELNLHGPPPSR